MLLNITGPGEGKSYANSVLNYQFRRVPGCIETLTSFTPQAFKYKQNRNACVVMIDDAHVTHEKTTKAVDRESNVIPNTFKNLLDTSVLESDVVTKDSNTGKVDTVKYQAVHNCGFVWNTNTMGFISDAWADRCLIMESEFPNHVPKTRSTKQLIDTVENCMMDRITEVCLYRQNMVQSATMIANSDIMQFSARFDKARDQCLAALYASHIMCMGVVGRRVAFCINQLVFAEAMKLACHFVFDIWIPPWTEIPEPDDYPDLDSYMASLNVNRLRALNRLSFGQICLETNAVYKLCTAACLPDICPRVVDMQGRFACSVLGYILTQIQEQKLKTSTKSNNLCISGIEGMYFDDSVIKGGNETAHEMLMLCAACRVPARGKNKITNRKLCTYRLAPSFTSAHTRRGNCNQRKKVSSVTISLEHVYDMLALYGAQSHMGFWEQSSSAMLEAYNNGTVEDVNALGQCRDDVQDRQPRLTFTLDFTSDPVRSLILAATAGVEVLNELSFDRSPLGGEIFHCSAPLYYGGVLIKAMGDNAPPGAYDEQHVRESQVGPCDTFHGPRLNVYSPKYSGVPVKNMCSFCPTRTVYHQDRITLRHNKDDRNYLFELDENWEWSDAAEVFNRARNSEAFTEAMLKLDYSVTMVTMGSVHREKQATPRRSDGHIALALRTGCSSQGHAEHTGSPASGDHGTRNVRKRSRNSSHGSWSSKKRM